MALDLQLLCDMRGHDDEAIVAVLSKCIGLRPKNEDGILRYTSRGLWGTVLDASKVTVQLAKNSFGIAPTKKFLFRLDKFEDFDTGLQTMVCICVKVISELSGDCALLTEDQPELLRRDGRITVQRYEDENWTHVLTEIVKGVGEPFSFEELPKVYD